MRVRCSRTSRMKHPSFEHEKEWRLMSLRELVPAQDIHLREAANGMLVPYVGIVIPPGSLREVWIGPGSEQHQESKRAAISGFLGNHRVSDVQIYASESPF